jgi:hypothetical protein
MLPAVPAAGSERALRAAAAAADVLEALMRKEDEMTQDVPKDVQVETKPEPVKELDTTQAEAVGGGTDACTIQSSIDQLQASYDTLVDTASYIMERVATAYKAL